MPPVEAGSLALDAIASLIGEHPDAIVEIGANVGDHTAPFADRFPKTDIHAIEPDERAFAALRDVAVSERISSPTVVPCRIIMVAPSYPSGGRLPNASSGEEYNKSGSLLEPTGHLIDHPWCVFEQQTTVVTRRLDSVTAELKLNRIDFI